uniref:Tyrosine-protein phosphatase n=1 Tax=Strongyloides papillosus TaxID=174720 RepID=A0A0N5B8T9_STREA
MGASKRSVAKLKVPPNLKTAEDNDKKQKVKEMNKNNLGDKSTYTSMGKVKMPSREDGNKSRCDVRNNKSKMSMPIKAKSGIIPHDNVNIVTGKKPKAQSKNVKTAIFNSKMNKKEFLKNEDEEGEGIEDGVKEPKNVSIGLTVDMTKTVVISADAEKDVRRKFCENLIKLKSIKAIVASKEFKDPKYKPNDLPATVFAKNVNLNRYSDVKCIDKTRVKLKRNLVGFKVKKGNKSSSNDEKLIGPDNDYIHANYVKIPNSDFTYICCQGPLENTLDDHWLMCWQENVKVIVMLCELEEDDSEKCNKYWPDLMTKKAYGGIMVSNEKEDFNKYSNVVIRTFRVQLGEVKRTVIQYHMKSWPDRLIPTGTPIICCLLREVQLVSGLNPIVVHCSAGIGRTGTFIGIHYASEKFKVSQDGSINVMEVIREMREQRLQSVQSTIQFGYLHICLLQYFCEENVFEFTDEVKKFIEKSVETVHEYSIRLAKKNKER